MATSFDTYSSGAFPLAWSPQQQASAAWTGQPITASFEPERANTGANLLAQLGLVPSQAMPAGTPHIGSMQTQTMLATTVAPSRSHLPLHQSADQMGLGCIETTSQGHLPFSYTASSQRYQTFSPARDTSESAQAVTSTPGSTGLATASPQGSSGKQFRFNPNAMPFVFQSSGAGDRFNDRSDSGATVADPRIRLSGDENSEVCLGGDAASVSAAVASAVISSPTSGPSLAPNALQFLSDTSPQPMQSQGPPPLLLPNSKTSSKSLWQSEPQSELGNGLTVWPQAAVLEPFESSQEPAHSHHDITPTASTSRSEAMSPMLMQLRGTAHSVALTCLPSPDLEPSSPPRVPGLSSDFSLSAAAI